MKPPIPDAKVACNGCTACCRSELVPIDEADGDPGQWKTEPYTGRDYGLGWTRQLKRREDGACIYLGETGCTIHDQPRPQVCRVFTCVGHVERYGVLAALKAAAAGNEVAKAGLERSFGARIDD